VSRVHDLFPDKNMYSTEGGFEATFSLVGPVTFGVTIQTPMVVDFGEGGGWALAGAGDGSEPQSVNS